MLVPQKKKGEMSSAPAPRAPRSCGVSGSVSVCLPDVDSVPSSMVQLTAWPSPTHSTVRDVTPSASSATALALMGGPWRSLALASTATRPCPPACCGHRERAPPRRKTRAEAVIMRELGLGLAQRRNACFERGAVLNGCARRGNGLGSAVQRQSVVAARRSSDGAGLCSCASPQGRSATFCLWARGWRWVDPAC